MNFAFVEIYVGELHFAFKLTDRSVFVANSTTWQYVVIIFFYKALPSTVPIMKVQHRALNKFG